MTDPKNSPQAETAGLYRKYDVRRLRDPAGKHDDCDYFVLDWEHDRFTVAAALAYADACEGEFPQLAEDLRARAGYKPQNSPHDEATLVAALRGLLRRWENRAKAQATAVRHIGYCREDLADLLDAYAHETPTEPQTPENAPPDETTPGEPLWDTPAAEGPGAFAHLEPPPNLAGIVAEAMAMAESRLRDRLAPYEQALPRWARTANQLPRTPDDTPDPADVGADPNGMSARVGASRDDVIRAHAALSTVAEAAQAADIDSDEMAWAQECLSIVRSTIRALEGEVDRQKQLTRGFAFLLSQCIEALGHFGSDKGRCKADEYHQRVRELLASHTPGEGSDGDQ